MESVDEKRKDLTFPVEQVLKKDLVELSNYSPKRRRSLYTELDENKEEYEWDFYPEHRDVIPDSTKENELAAFEAAKLLLATAIEKAGDSDLESQKFVDQFEEGEREFVRQFDDFRRKFSQIDESNLERNIKNKEGEVYEFVSEEIKTQADLQQTLLNTSANEIRTAAISYFLKEFDEFFSLANQAVFLYIKHHGLPNTIESVVDAAEAAADSRQERQRIQAEFAAELESLSESIEQSLYHQERRLKAQMGHLQHEIETGGTDTETLEDKLAEIKDDIEAISDQQFADAKKITTKLETLTGLEADLAQKIEELEIAQQETREELQDEEDSEAESLIEEELSRLAEQKADLDAEIRRLQNERKRLETTGERLDRDFGELQERIETAEERVDQEVSDLTDRVEEISESVRTQRDTPNGKAIQAEVARLYEMDYITRFETSVRETSHLTLPDGETFDIPKGFWDDRRRHFTGDHRLMVTDVLDGDEVVDRYPVGRYSSFRVVTNKFVAFSETKLIVEAIVAANLQAFAKNGFDARPAGIDDLIDIVNETVVRADSNETTHLVGIASPTGWTDEVEQFVQSKDTARARFDQQVSVCLVDIQSNELIYDRNDRLVSNNVEFFEREVDSERISDCIEMLREEYISDPMTEVLRHHVIVERHDFGPHIVRAAFERLADDGYGVTGYPTTADGLCLVVD